jgi:hypothetical protein
MHRVAPVPNPLVGAMYPPQPLHWQILTFLAFAVPFCVCLYKFDVNIAFGVFFITYFIMSIIASFRAAQISRRFRVNENEFLAFMQQQQQANPRAVQDQSTALHLYLAMLDRDFTENDYELLSTLDDVTEKHGASVDQIKSLEEEKFGDLNDTAAPPPAYRCAICLDTFTIKDTVKCLPCSHLYHGNCIDEWLSRKPNCPICKRDTFD